MLHERFLPLQRQLTDGGFLPVVQPLGECIAVIARARQVLPVVLPIAPQNVGERSFGRLLALDVYVARLHEERPSSYTWNTPTLWKWARIAGLAR
jgi:hypothetical protein